MRNFAFCLAVMSTLIVIGVLADRGLKLAGVHLYGDWIQIHGGSLVTLDAPIDVTIAEIRPGLTHYAAGGKCSLDERNLMSVYRGIDFRVVGQEKAASGLGAFLVEVDPYSIRVVPLVAICGATKIFMSLEDLERLRAAARDQIPADQQITTPETAQRMATVQREGR